MVNNIDGSSSHLCIRSHLPVGGRLTHFAHFWEQHVQDSWALEVVREGYALEFEGPPPTFRGVRATRAMGDRARFLREEIQSLLLKNAIERVPPGEVKEGFYSTFFLTSKKDGTWRPILNLKPLNLHLRHRTFKMETLRSVVRAVDPGDWMASIDLKDAYLHVPIRKSHHKYLRFFFEGVAYQCKVLMFGLRTGPFVWTKILAPIMAMIHRWGIYVSPYLDDLILKNADRSALVEQPTGVPADHNKRRFHYQPREVGASTVPRPGIHRGSAQNRPGLGDTTTRSDGGLPPIHVQTQSRVNPDGWIFPAYPGHDRCHVGRGTVCTVTNETASGTPKTSLESGSPATVHEDSSDGKADALSPMVVFKRQPACRPSPLSPQTQRDNHVRCFQERLGCFSAGTCGTRALGPLGESLPYKLSGTQSHLAGSQGFPGQCRGEGSVMPMRQHHGLCLHQQDGGHQVPGVDESLDSSHGVVHREKHTPASGSPPWRKECFGRHAFQDGDRPQGMVPEHQGNGSTVFNMGETSGRSVCVQTECQAPHFLFPSPGRGDGSELGRTFHDVVQRRTLRVSSSGNDTDCAGQDQAGPSSSSNSHSAKLAQEILVPPSLEPLTRAANRVAHAGGDAGAADAEGQGQDPAAPQPRPTAPDGLASLRRRFQGRGFSANVATTLLANRGQSTYKKYNECWKAFVNWMAEKGTQILPQLPSRPSWSTSSPCWTQGQHPVHLMCTHRLFPHFI